jgi:hypothetical protein
LAGVMEVVATAKRQGCGGQGVFSSFLLPGILTKTGEAELLLVTGANEDNPSRREGSGTIGRKARFLGDGELTPSW